MKKTEAFELLAPGLKGPDAINRVAFLCRITYQSVSGWPDELSNRISDRVMAAYFRSNPSQKRAKWPVDNRPWLIDSNGHIG